MRIIAFDCETTGLEPEFDRVTLAQYKVNDGPVRLLHNPDPNELHSILDSADIIIGHNLQFDFSFIDYVPQSVDHWDDTFLLSRVQDFKEDKHSLDAVLQRKLGYDPYEGMDKKKLQKSDWSNPNLTKEQLKYATIDVDYLHTLYNFFKPSVLNPVYRFDKKSAVDGMLIGQHGLPVLHDEVVAELQTQLDLYNAACEELPVNPNSPKQVSQLLRSASTGDRVLAEMIAEGNEAAKHVRTARSAKKYAGFLEKLLKYARFYGTLKPHARSGRFTSSNENLQNLPRDTKRFIGHKDNVLISADFAQLELRTIACLAEDLNMIKLFREGKDLHNYVAESVFGPNYTKRDRQIAKTLSFSLLYGAGAATVREMLIQQTGIVLSEQEVQTLKRDWLNTFPDIAAWQKAGWYNHDNGVPATTPHGRKAVSKRFTDHLSIINQGAGAEVARIALHVIMKNLPKGAELINYVHDSYLVECPNDPAIYKAACKVVYDGMAYGWHRAPFDKHGVPMPIDVAVAHNWKDADSLENCLHIYSGE